MSARHRGEQRDSLGDALTALGILGHTIALGLLTDLIVNHDRADAVERAPSAAAPDNPAF
ncbi:MULTISPECIES: hypothetical protein [Streptomyces]|uniref:Uncharacterized protein n=1 Tax=Streptomyces tsukubensis (strain DSM 42081 / NBRC 108919 / NRRL 18488 / 9993) TaxID=1114943 RepID=A0A7G3UGF6_STRT9|nr:MULTISPECIES: hypothetical protein [Streptomyces]AZK94393.1 hypothetical protein B7R87_11385 [Streptomyces tsukubensis]MYS63406.1 hypothetical protein [Streptomyces sp. SID5473]QKM69513.1 hypothetical protein STSU_022405 [Streptomyces tsukubensis NRRL18488]TAI42558.1 hypothetical protein EWI31_19125 [Streptomyces tsukubensis]